MDQEYPKNPSFFLRKKIIQNAKTQKRLEICQYKWYTLRPEVSNPSGSVVSTIFFKANSEKILFFLHCDFRPLPRKNVQMWDHFFPFLFPKDVGAKRPLNSTSKVNGQRNKKTDRQTHIWTFRLIESIGPEGRCFENPPYGDKDSLDQCTIGIGWTPHKYWLTLETQIFSTVYTKH